MPCHRAPKAVAICNSHTELKSTIIGCGDQFYTSSTERPQSDFIEYALCGVLFFKFNSRTDPDRLSITEVVSVSDFNKARDALQKFFGFTDFREGQADVIETVLAGQDAVVVMPTGGGKSLCYQLPALIRDGVTMVVSPLIALMKDQVDQLSSRGIPSTFINSSISLREINERLSGLRMNRYRLLYVAPERFRSDSFTRAIAEVKIRLFAVDEAHCISHWGHDFRPDYLRLKQAVELLGRPQVIALTATATPQVRADICAQLGLTDSKVFVAGFDRPNLALRVVHVKTEKDKLAILKRLITDSTGSGIIYTSTRKAAEQVAARLQMSGLRADVYHGGMEEGERTQAQDRFMSGHSQAIVATNAFGMGIDKPDIRFVAHFHIPGSVEAYYQEVGRAGRDSLPAECVMLFNYADTRMQQFFIDGSHPSPEIIARVYETIASVGTEKVELSAREIAERLRIKNEMAIYSSLVILEKAGHIERGRAAGSQLLCWSKLTVDEALAAVPDDSNEGGVLRDLIFTRNINQREPTELDIASIGASLGITDAQARRAISQLAARGILDCRNAFQGRGIRLLDAGAKALRIDRQELAARASAEQWKLRRMVDYCYHQSCLRRFILNYFGDRKPLTRCEACSSCSPETSRFADGATRRKTQTGTLALSAKKTATEMDHFIIEHAPTGRELRVELKKKALQSRAAAVEEEKRARSLDESETVVVKKILSCVARMNDRFGKGTVALVLAGSTSRQVKENNLDRLSTYGLLKNMTRDEITSYIKALIDAGCIKVSSGAYPTVSLTQFGRDVMTGRAEAKLEIQGMN
ncbi:MAG: ATP-dependent DNA helicase RecQ [Acidobacteriota bacterium]